LTRTAIWGPRSAPGGRPEEGGGLPPTERVYLEDPYARPIRARVLRSVRDGGRRYVVLDSTVFHPRGGGQPSDGGSWPTTGP